MTLLNRYQEYEQERRVMVAQSVVWLNCVAFIIIMVFALLSSRGRAIVATTWTVHPVRATISLAIVALYFLAGYLIGERRVVGGVIGLALFSYTLVDAVARGHLVSWSAAFALVGVIVILRAGRALHLPFFAPAG